jgi:uncharacterized membrane protein YeaQ/YmgE (transglycosylase-associated protein family)
MSSIAAARIGWRRCAWVVLAMLVSLAIASAARAQGAGAIAGRHALQPHVLMPDSAQKKSIAAIAGAQLVTPKATLAPAYFAERVYRPRTEIRGMLLHKEIPILFTGTGGSGQQLNLIVVVEADELGLRMNPSGDAYAGTLRVGVDDVSQPGNQVALAPGTRLEVFADNASVNPPDLAVPNAGYPYPRVALESRAPTDSVRITIRATFRKEPIVTWVPVIRPRVLLNGPKHLDGLGVGSAPLTLTVSPDAGNRLRQVSLVPSMGALDSASVLTSPGRLATVHYRSARLGRDEVSASSDPLAQVVWPIQLDFPWAFFLAALLGGTAGALVLALLRKRKSTDSAIRHLLAGILMGAIVAAAYILGLNLTAVPLQPQNNEFAVAVIAAIGAISVLPITERLSPVAKKALHGSAAA